MKMKKLITVLCIVAIAASFAACSNNTADGKKAEQSTVSTTVSTTVAKTEKTADAVAKALNFSDKEEKAFGVIGASDGAAYTTAGGNHAEIYIYTDNQADGYKAFFEDGTVEINNNVMLYLDGKADTDENKEIIKEFKSLNF